MMRRFILPAPCSSALRCFRSEYGFEVEHRSLSRLPASQRLGWAALPLTIDIVIPTSGRYDLTGNCLSHLARQTRPHTVIVSDNGGGETAERVGRDWPAVRLIRSSGRLSFAAACNRGANAGDGEVV